jgi:hypothetical protein
MPQRTFDAAFPSRYLTSGDVEGKRFTATIKQIEYCKMADGQEKPVAFFQGMKKGIVLNKSKAKLLAELSKSKKFDDWVGVAVEIYGSVTDLRGEEVACIKFAKTAKQKAKAVKEALDGDDLPDELKGDKADADGADDDEDDL